MILNAMRTHIDNAGVCENGCGALWNITANGKQNSQQTKYEPYQIPIDNNKVRAGEAGAIDVILSAMGRHIDNANICMRGCWALMNITVNGKQNTQKMKYGPYQTPQPTTK